MVRRDNFINKLRELGYKYKDQSDRMHEYKLVGGTNRIHIRKKEDPLSDEYVRSVLRQCGCRPEEIERFLATNQCTLH